MIRKVWEFLLKHKKRSAAALAVTILLAGGWVWRRSRQSAGGPEEELAKVSRGDLEVRFHESGEVVPKRAVDIVSKASGRILEVWVEEGARVVRGQKLVLVQPGKTEVEKYVPVEITSPLDGVVMPPPKKDRYGEVRGLARAGDYVTGLFDSSDPTVLMTVADTSIMAVGLKISEMDILKLKEEMPVKVQVDALPEAKFEAKVSLISPRAQPDENGLKMFRVEATLNKVDPRLRLGMSASVDAVLEERKGVLKVPLSAIFEEGTAFAYLKPLKGKARKVQVELGLKSETEAEVTKGLSESDELFTQKPEEIEKEEKEAGAKSGRRVRRLLRLRG